MCDGNSTFPIFKSVFVVNKYSSGISVIQHTLVFGNDNETESVARFLMLHNEVNV